MQKNKCKQHTLYLSKTELLHIKNYNKKYILYILQCNTRNVELCEIKNVEKQLKINVYKIELQIGIIRDF